MFFWLDVKVKTEANVRPLERSVLSAAMVGALVPTRNYLHASFHLIIITQRG